MLWKSWFSCLAVALLATTSAQAAIYVSDTDVILNPHETDIASALKTGDMIATWDLKSAKKARISNPTGGVTPPAVGGTSSSFFDVFIEIEFEGEGPFTGHGTGQVNITGVPLNGLPPGTVVEGLDFVSLSAVLSDAAGTASYMIRESPSKASTGQTLIRESPTLPGQFQINSFFDIFTELSVDGGQTWIPASSAMHMESVPEPSTFVLGALGILGLGLVARRKKVRRE